MRYLGIDVGTKRVGLATSDDEGRMAFPLRVIDMGPDLVARVEEIIKETNAEAVVMGDSRNFKGEENPVMKKVHRFRRDLESRTGIAAHLESEVLSSQEAARFQEDAEKLDASAAAIILQSFLDKQHRD